MTRTVAHQLEQGYMIKKIGNRGTRVYVIQLRTNLTGADCYVRGN